MKVQLPAQLAVNLPKRHVAVGAELPGVFVVLPLLSIDHVHRADAEVVEHVLLEARHREGEVPPRTQSARKRRPALRPFLAVHPDLVLDTAFGCPRAAVGHRAGELHVGIAHVENRVGQARTTLPDDDRHERIGAAAHRPLRHEPSVVVPIGRLQRGIVLRLDPVRRTHPLRVAALIHETVERARAVLLAADDEIFVGGVLVVHDRIVERKASGRGGLFLTVQIRVEELVGRAVRVHAPIVDERPVVPSRGRHAVYLEDLELVLLGRSGPDAKFRRGILFVILDAPALVRVLALARDEVGPFRRRLVQLVPTGIREHVADARAEDVVVVERDDASEGRGRARRLRHAPRIADTAVFIRQGQRVSLGFEIVRRRILQVVHAVVRLIHVPHADVRLERVAGIRRRGDKRAAVAHRELRPVVHLRKPHPEERHAVLVPRIDLVRDDMPLFVHEGDVAAVVVVEVVVRKAVVVLGADLDKHREVRKRLRSRVARHGERQEALEVFHHPESVRAVVEEARVGRTDRLPFLAKRRERTRNSLRLLVVIAVGPELVAVRRPRRQVRGRVRKNVVLDKPRLERRPVRLALARRPDLPLDDAGSRIAERPHFAADLDEIVPYLHDARRSAPQDRQFGFRRKGASDRRRRLAVVGDRTKLVVVGGGR